MEIVRLIIFTGVISALGINGAPTGEVKEHMILDKFLKIKDSCLQHRDSYNTQNNKADKQILCIMVMSAIEVDDKNYFPVDRIKYILNIKSKEREDIPLFFGKEKLHGEIQAVRLDNDIQQLIQNFSKSSKTAGEGLPYVFVYSYFIPCASVPNVRYSCAEELATHARLNYNSNFNMLVGYSDVFLGTNFDLANDYLHQRGMFALVDIQNETVKMGTDPTFFEPQITVFQDKLHECILSACGDCSIVRNKINCLVQSCTSASKEHGPLTHLGMWFMHYCFENKIIWIDNKIREKLEIVKCLLNVMEDNYKDPRTLLVLGIPEHGTDTPYWTPSDIKSEWGLVYNDYQPPANIGTLNISTDYKPDARIQENKSQIRFARNRNQNDYNRNQNDYNRNQNDYSARGRRKPQKTELKVYGDCD